MATFPNYNPIFPATKRIDPQTRVTAFNDGYQHRISFGLNQNPQIWNLTFNLDEEDTLEVETFLNARADDAESFDWSPPDSALTFKWIATPYNKQLFQPGRNIIRVTFSQVFEP